jgi:hypothetical protein
MPVLPVKNAEPPMTQPGAVFPVIGSLMICADAIRALATSARLSATTKPVAVPLIISVGARPRTDGTH